MAKIQRDVKVRWHMYISMGKREPISKCNMTMKEKSPKPNAQIDLLTNGVSLISEDKRSVAIASNTKCQNSSRKLCLIHCFKQFLPEIWFLVLKYIGIDTKITLKFVETRTL